MVNLKDRLELVRILGDNLNEQINSGNSDNKFWSAIQKQHQANPWITEEFSLEAIQTFIQQLSSSFYSDLAKDIGDKIHSKDIGLIINRNYPLAGCHELIISFIAGHRIWMKEDNNKHILLQTIGSTLSDIAPDVTNQFNFAPVFPKSLENWIIQNTRERKNQALYQYFEQKNCLFIPQYPAYAILNGNETESDLDCLANLIFVYWGFHPDNVRKLFVPRGYLLDPIFQAMEKYNYVYNHNRYANNYDYHKSVYLMDRKPFFDNGFIMLVNSELHDLPIGCLGYEEYDVSEKKVGILSENKENILFRNQKIKPGNFSKSKIHSIEIPLIIDFLNKLK